MERKVFKIFSAGGMGEAIFVSPTFRAIKSQYPSSKTEVICGNFMHYEVYQHNPFIDRLTKNYVLMGITPFWKSPIQGIRGLLDHKEYIGNEYGADCPSIVYDHQHASDVIADYIGVKLAGEKSEIFLTAQEKELAQKRMRAYKNTIVIHTKAGYTENKDWVWERWIELVKRNPQYTFIQIGKAHEKYVEGCVDFRGMSIREHFAVISQANGYVGLDSGFAHAASAFNIKTVILFGPSSVTLWGHENTINLYAGLRCSPCLHILRSDPCPYGKPCMTELTVEKVESALQKALASPAE